MTEAQTMPLDHDKEGSELVEVIEYLKALDRLLAQMGCSCTGCRAKVASLPHDYIIDATTEIRELAYYTHDRDNPDTIEVIACSKTLQPLLFDEEHGWQSPELN